MQLSELTTLQLSQLVKDAKDLYVMTDLLRSAISTKFNKPIEQVKLTDMIAFGWDVADELAKRLL